MPQNFAQVRQLVIQAEQAGQRVDNFLLRELKNVPKSHIYRLLRSGQVRVNGGRVKPTRRLQDGDCLRIPPLRDVGQRSTLRVPDDGRREILEAIIYEDDALLVLNKPAGWAAHAGSGVPYGVIDALRQSRTELSYLELAHRLDRETSGCLLLAKHRDALQALHAGFRDSGGEFAHEKRYLALLDGCWKGGEQAVDLPLASQQLASGERMVKVDKDTGRAARSRFALREQFSDCCLVEVGIDTGRMHQIRVHAQALGHAVIGDRKYGERERNQIFRRRGLKRMFLHASRIDVTLLGQRHAFEAPLPAELSAFLESLRRDR